MKLKRRLIKYGLNCIDISEEDNLICFSYSNKKLIEIYKFVNIENIDNYELKYVIKDLMYPVSVVKFSINNFRLLCISNFEINIYTRNKDNYNYLENNICVLNGNAVNISNGIWDNNDNIICCTGNGQLYFCYYNNDLKHYLGELIKG